jgi:AAA+ superfamily predicted ATPase
MGDIRVFFWGFVAGVVLCAVIGTIAQFRRPRSVRKLLLKHFNRISEGRIEIHSREFPYRAAPDAYLAVSDWLRTSCSHVTAIGVPVTNTFMSSIGIAAILSPGSECYYPTALEYESFDVGEDEPRQCVKHALWLVEHQRQKLALLWTSETSHGGCGFQTKLHLDVAHAKDGPGDAAAHDFFRQLEKRIQQAASYRGKILSLEASTDYRGHSGGIVVHQLRPIKRDDVILPETTVRLLERNVVRFVQQRPELAKLGMPTKKGLLLYGPPGTGKTHTIHYLIGAMPGHTTLLVTAEQVGMLDEYITLARLLQPSIVVLEDVDLIGRDREHMSPGTESLLNRLLNEMDGLRADAEILFLLTTNRPESLERALAARPGRVDQAIEFPLPDEAGRRKLIRLYAAGAAVSDEVVGHTARITDGVSASFIKELMRRAIQFHLECRSDGDAVQILQNDVDQAIDELLFVGGSLNRTLLGADGNSAD